MMLNLKRFFVLLFLLLAFLFVSALSYVNAVSENIASGVLRLHVIANSNTQADQSLKLKVRDRLLDHMNFLTENCHSKQEVIEIAKKHQNDFEEIARQVIRENGFDYEVTTEIGRSDFPTKYYGDVTLPAGTYDAFKVKIGKAQGQNWWCVMFPPLCFVDVSTGIVPEESKQEMKNNMDEEEYNLISSPQDSGIQFKFKLVELFQNLRLGLR